MGFLCKEHLYYGIFFVIYLLANINQKLKNYYFILIFSVELANQYLQPTTFSMLKSTTIDLFFDTFTVGESPTVSNFIYKSKLCTCRNEKQRKWKVEERN
jgi:hypothetical protein